MIDRTRFATDRAIGWQQSLARSIATGEQQIATGKRLTAPSDDPAATARLATLRRDFSDDTATRLNLDRAAALAAQADTALGSVADLLGRASELTLAAASGIASPADRATAATALRAIAADIAQIAATRDSSGAPLFADGRPLAIPVGGETIVSADGRTATFGVPFGGQTLALPDLITRAANALEAGDQAAIDALLDPLAAAETHIAGKRAETGIAAERIDRLTVQIETRSLTLDAERSTLEDTDLSETIARINATQVTLQAAQAIYARLNQSSLFDLLR